MIDGPGLGYPPPVQGKEGPARRGAFAGGRGAVRCISLSLCLSLAALLPGTVLAETPPDPVAPKKDFLAALAEVTAFNVLPLLWNRIVLNKPMGYVTLNTWKENLSRGFAYDPDKFVTNVLSHPQHGGLYYAAARANGFTLWESAAFTAFGSVTWEYFGEVSRPSTNDLINTTFAGITAGETSYRLSDLIFDNTETGFPRFLHEFAGLAVSPGRAFQRLLSGDAWRVGPNPSDRGPEWLGADLRGGLLSVESSRPGQPSSRKGRGTISWDVRYGDAFEKDLGKPFSAFRLEAEVTTAQNFVSRIDSEGILAGWRLDDSPERRTYLAATLGFLFDNVDLEYGGETMGLELASRIPAGKGYEIVPRAQLLTAY